MFARALAARPGSFEHHLTIVARAGDAQLELACASEPLYFAHVNVSDEWALALPTGDAMIDRMPMRTFLADAASGADVARYHHRVGDLVLHPLGPMHWTGRLRPPYAPFLFGPGMRRAGLSLVFCAAAPTPVRDRPLGVTDGRAADAKPYAAGSLVASAPQQAAGAAPGFPPAAGPGGPPPLSLCELGREPPGIVARVGDATLALLVRPARVAAPRGAYLVVLEAQPDAPHHDCDLIHLAPGASLDGAGIARALLFSGESGPAQPPPPSWSAPPAPPTAPFDERARLALPFADGALAVRALDDAQVAIAVAGAQAAVPRHWLARMLFRLALHRPMIGYVETYGGLFWDDRRGADEGVRFGLRAGASLTLPSARAHALAEQLYRAVAPPGYAEITD
jgi:hypothetical protein